MRKGTGLASLKRKDDDLSWRNPHSHICYMEGKKDGYIEMG
jgi:hypothetical protein